MILTLIKREIQDKIYSAQFLIIVVLCVILIPLGLYVSMKDFEKQQTDYMNNVQQYFAKSQHKVNHVFHAEGYRPPSALNIFSTGLNDYLPYRVTTDRHKGYTIETKIQQSNLISILFGKIDFTLIVTSFLSILSIIFTFSCVSSEKESGTIRLIFSNSVQRWRLVVAKILGNYLLFCIPFCITIIIGLLILNTSPYISIFSSGFWLPFLFIMLITLLLIFLLFNFGFFISTITHNSLTSIITLLFVWVFFAFVIPKVSPMIAQILHPVDTVEVFESKKSALMDDMDKEYKKQLKTLLEEKLTAHHIDYSDIRDLSSAITNEARDDYNMEKTVMDEEYGNRRKSELTKFENSYFNRQQTQYSVSRKMARVSPISSYISLMAEMCHTGFGEINNFRRQAALLQEQAQDHVYKYWQAMYYAAGPRTQEGYRFNQQYDIKQKDIPVPELQYKQLSFGNIIRYIWVDIMFIVFFCILFFVLGFVSFLRYDVR